MYTYRYCRWSYCILRALVCYIHMYTYMYIYIYLSKFLCTYRYCWWSYCISDRPCYHRGFPFSFLPFVFFFVFLFAAPDFEMCNYIFSIPVSLVNFHTRDCIHSHTQTQVKYGGFGKWIYISLFIRRHVCMDICIRIHTYIYTYIYA